MKLFTWVNGLVLALAGVFVAWSVYVSWSAGMLLGGSMSAIIFASVSVTLCVGLISRYKTWVFWVLMPLAMAFEGLSFYAVDRAEASQSNSLSQTVIQQQLSEAEIEVQMALANLKASIERKQIKVEQKRPIADVNQEIRADQKAYDKAKENLEAVRIQSEFHHGSAAYGALAKLLKIEQSSVESLIAVLRALAAFLCGIYMYQLAGHCLHMSYVRSGSAFVRSSHIASQSYDYSQSTSNVQWCASELVCPAHGVQATPRVLSDAPHKVVAQDVKVENVQLVKTACANKESKPSTSKRERMVWTDKVKRDVVELAKIRYSDKPTDAALRSASYDLYQRRPSAPVMSALKDLISATGKVIELQSDSNVLYFKS